MKKITKKWLKKIKACCPESDMDRAEKELKGDIELIVKVLLNEDRFNDANWLLTQLMNKEQKVSYDTWTAAACAADVANVIWATDAAGVAIRAAADAYDKKDLQVRILEKGIEILKERR